MSHSTKGSKVLHMQVWGYEKWAFVQDPTLRGRWIRTHRSANAVACILPHCESQIGEPCKGPQGHYLTEVHPVRKDAYYKRQTSELEREQFKVIKGKKRKA